VIATVSWPARIEKLSPIATVLGVARSSLPRNVPAELAVQNDTCEYVSAADTLVQFRSAVVVDDPPDADPNVACTRVVFAAGDVVPAEPGSARWSFTQNAVGAV
jgi:hypothetical protein